MTNTSTGTSSESHLSAGTAFGSEYILDAFGESHPSWGKWQVRVLRRGHESWAIQHPDTLAVLDRDGNWVPEPPPEDRTGVFCAATRFPFLDALARAREILPTLSFYGMTAAGVIARPVFSNSEDDL